MSAREGGSGRQGHRLPDDERFVLRRQDGRFRTESMAGYPGGPRAGWDPDPRHAHRMLAPDARSTAQRTKVPCTIVPWSDVAPPPPEPLPDPPARSFPPAGARALYDALEQLLTLHEARPSRGVGVDITRQARQLLDRGRPGPDDRLVL